MAPPLKSSRTVELQMGSTIEHWISTASLVEVPHIISLMSDMHSAHADRRLQVDSLVEVLHSIESATASSTLPTKMLYEKVRAKLVNST
jgi:hypothetical protein